MGRRLDLTERVPFKEGTCARIYQIGSRAVKVNFDKVSWKYNIRLEYQVQKDLYNAGISVPKPYGVIKVIDGVGRKNLGLIMKKIEGTNLEKVNDAKSLEKMNQELERAKSLGFKLNDGGERNAMVDKTGKVYLIDFGYFCRSPKKLE